jgi:phospholipid/cholesterol/gamma-HCH transport system permease protein
VKVGSLLKAPVSQLGASIIQSMNGLGSISIFSGRFLYWLFRPPWRARLLFAQLYFIGNRSVFIICLAGAFTGMVMAYQTYFGFKLISVDSLVGPVVAIALAKELAPVMSGLIVAGRAGAAMAAQIGTMKVTEQVDALEVMGIDPIQYLVVPRVIAGFFSVPMLTCIFMFVGNVGSWVVGTKALGIDETLYFSKLSDFMHVEDMLQGVIKAFAFGLIVSVIGTYFGLQAQKGAEDVGRSTNLAVVWGMILVLTSDYILTSFLVKIL